MRQNVLLLGVCQHHLTDCVHLSSTSATTTCTQYTRPCASHVLMAANYHSHIGCLRDTAALAHSISSAGITVPSLARNVPLLKKPHHPPPQAFTLKLRMPSTHAQLHSSSIDHVQASYWNDPQSGGISSLELWCFFSTVWPTSKCCCCYSQSLQDRPEHPCGEPKHSYNTE
jgi:hypothetical protein